MPEDVLEKTRPDTAVLEKADRPPDQAQRDLILRELDRSLLVEAAAGTGKTTSLVGRMLALLRGNRCTTRTLAAVTFTRKAAAELRSRFQAELEAVVRSGRLEPEERARLRAALAQVDLCFIGTIHAFCARLLRERPVEAGVDLDFEEIDEDADWRLRSEAWRLHAAALLAEDPEGLLPALERLDLRLSDLEPAFLTFATYPDVEEWPVPGPEHRLPDTGPLLRALHDYLGHMRELAPRLPVRPAQTDSLARAYRRLPRVASHLDKLALDPRQLMRLLEEFRGRAQASLAAWEATGNFSRREAREESERWNAFREEHALPQLRAWYELRYGTVMRVLASARRTYDRLRAERGLLNFQDLLMRAAALLRDHAEVRRYFARRFTHLLVDEFQDTDPIQAEVMLLLTATDPEERDWQSCRPRPGSLFVVGDPKQSIYRFRRADIVTYGLVKRILEQEGPAVRLSANFRSTRQLIDWVNQVFEPSFPDAATESSPEYVPLLAGSRTSGAEPAVGGALALRVDAQSSRRNEEAAADDADRVARTIRCLLDAGTTVLDPRSGEARPVGPADFMILAATRANLSAYARRLRSYGVPHQVTGGSGLNEVSELRLLWLCLCAALQPENPVALVAALRSEAFGVSDAALYAFKKAGGRFSYRSRVPVGAGREVRAAIGQAFRKLRAHARWLDSLPPLAAVERIVADLGLMVLAASREGGELEAGSLGKALEKLRAAERMTSSAVELLELLAALVEREERLDGISALPERTDVVRVMNLHKAKGLEATVVFLADPTGASTHPAEVHIDRSGGRARGYMAVNRIRGRGREVVAQPVGWDEHARREGQFLEDEKLRLRYVAATRARSLLVVSQRPAANHRNPWQPFEGKLEGELKDPGPQAAPAVPCLPLDQAAVRLATAAIEERLAAARRPTYQVLAAKSYALAEAQAGSEEILVTPAGAPLVAGPQGEPVVGSGGAPVEPGEWEERGPEWGAVVHLLLQTAAEQPDASLEGLAAAALAEQEMDTALAPAVTELVRAVSASPLWARARRARRRFAEVPFQVPRNTTGPDGSGVPAILRGVIDLAFEEPDGWVLVDYKTDQVGGPALLAAAARHAAQLRLYAEAWVQCTGQPVKEAGLFFIRAAEYVRLASVERRPVDAGAA